MEPDADPQNFICEKYFLELVAPGPSLRYFPIHFVTVAVYKVKLWVIISNPYQESFVRQLHTPILLQIRS